MNDKKDNEEKKLTPDQQKLIDFTMGEFQKILGDIKKGKTPKISNNLATIQETIASVDLNTTEDEMEKIVQELTKKIGK